MPPDTQQNLYEQPVQDLPSQPVPPADLTTTPQAVEPTEVTAPADNGPVLSWQASEYIQHDKNGLWFLALLGVAVVFLAVDIFLIKSWTFGILIAVMTASVFILARRQPRVVNYNLTPQTLQIDEKHFSTRDFRAFGIIQEGATQSVQLIPVKRFMPAVNVYFPVELGEQIVDTLGVVLPMEKIEPDFIDKLTQKVRF